MDAAVGDRNLLYRAGVLLIALILGLLLFEFAKWAWYSPVELGAYDMLLHMRPAPSPRSDIAILAIDSKTTDAMGRLAWSTSTHARIINALNKAGAKFVVYDMPLSGSDTAHPGDDSAFRRAMNAKRNVILSMSYDPLRDRSWNAADLTSLIGLERFAISGRIAYTRATTKYRYYYFIPPIADFMTSARDVGVSVGPPSGTEVVRQADLAYLTTVQYPVPSEPLPADTILPKFNGDTVVLQGLPLVVSRAIFDVGKQNVNVNFTHGITLSADLSPGVDIPIDERGGMWINYAGPAGSYPQYSAVDLLRGNIKTDVFSGKTVFVGVADAAAPFPTLSTPYGRMSEVEISANSVGTILDRSYIVRNTPEALIVMLVLSIILGLLYPSVDLSGMGPLSLWLSLAYITADVLALTFFRQVWPVIPAVVLVLLSAIAAALLKPVLFVPMEIPREGYEPGSRAA